jgi:hypothetical protein
VTNREFRKFVNDAGYVTFAEIPPDPKDYPGTLPHMLKAASLTFMPPKHAVDTRDWSQWNFKFGANWRRPYGPRSSNSGLDDHPVVHLAYCDVELTRHGPTRSCRRKPSGNSRSNLSPRCSNASVLNATRPSQTRRSLQAARPVALGARGGGSQGVR